MEPRLYIGYVGYPPLGPMLYSTSLPKSPGSAAQARRFLDRVRDDVSEPVLENARLLVSELVANAVEHVHEDGEIELRVELTRSVLRIEVLDPGPGFEPRPRAADSDRGWGLHFIDRLAVRWAADHPDHPDRSRVWFELQLLSDS
jgi:two-component sensor histidine kinase